MTYQEFIQDIINTRGQWNIPKGEYYEKHHIIPRCMGGSNDKENIIYLYAKEHFIAHQLLAEENPDNISLQYAFGAMGQNNRGLRDYILTPEGYEKTRIAYSIANSKRVSGKGNPMYGKSAIKGKHIHSDEFKQKLSARVSGKNNPMCIHHDEIFTDKYKSEMSERARICAKKYWDNISDEEYKIRCLERTGSKNGMYGKYGRSKNSVKVRCVETNEEFVSISDAVRKTKISSIKKALKSGSCAGGYHWERI